MAHFDPGRKQTGFLETPTQWTPETDVVYGIRATRLATWSASEHVGQNRSQLRANEHTPRVLSSPFPARRVRPRQVSSSGTGDTEGESAIVDDQCHADRLATGRRGSAFPRTASLNGEAYPMGVRQHGTGKTASPPRKKAANKNRE